VVRLDGERHGHRGMPWEEPAPARCSAADLYAGKELPRAPPSDHALDALRKDVGSQSRRGEPAGQDGAAREDGDPASTGGAASAPGCITVQIGGRHRSESRFTRSEMPRSHSPTRRCGPPAASGRTAPMRQVGALVASPLPVGRHGRARLASALPNHASSAAQWRRRASTTAWSPLKGAAIGSGGRSSPCRPGPVRRQWPGAACRRGRRPAPSEPAARPAGRRPDAPGLAGNPIGSSCPGWW
jgi:hypothetical protein